MNIVIIGSAHPLRGGGIATFNERLATYLQDEQQDNVTIYSYSLQYPNFLFPGKSQYTDEPAPKGLKIHQKINSVNPLNWISVGKELKDLRPDLIIVRYWMPFFGPCLGTILRQVRKNNHTKIICIADNVIAHEPRIGDKQMTNYFIKPIDAFITMSKSVLKDLHLFAPSQPASFLPHPVYDNFGTAIPKEDARQQLNIGTDEKVILFFGFIRKYKGLDILLECLADPRLKDRNVRLLIAGEYYDDAKEYEAIIEQHQLKDRIYAFTDFIPNDEVAQYFCAADCVVQPYRTATQSGITQVCYHFEKPMIVTNVGGLGEIVPNEKVGYVVENENDAIVNAICKFYDENKMAYFESELKIEKQKYSWKYFVEGINALYDRIK